MANDEQQQMATTGGKSNQTGLYIGIAVVIAIIIAILFIMNSNGTATTSTTVLSVNMSAPGIYMNVSDAQILLGSPILNYSYNYSASSIFNYSSPANITLLEGLAPAITGNVTNGWVTTAFGSGPSAAGIQYFVLQTNNPGEVATDLAQAVNSTFANSTITYGLYNGLNYSYESYRNNTTSFQIVVGWKGNYVALADLIANNYTSNQSQMASIVSGNLP